MAWDALLGKWTNSGQAAGNTATLPSGAPDPNQFQDYGQYMQAYNAWDVPGSWSAGGTFDLTPRRYTPGNKAPAVTEQAFYGQRAAAQGPQVLSRAYQGLGEWAGGARGYENALRGLIENPNAALGNFAPFQWMMEQGVNQAKRRAAARGMLGSGNLLGELTELGTGLAGQNFFKMAELLNQLATGRAGGYESLAGLALRGQGLGIEESNVVNAAQARNQQNALARRQMELEQQRAAAAERGAQDALQWLMGQGGGDFGASAMDWGSQYMPETDLGYYPSDYGSPVDAGIWYEPQYSEGTIPIYE